jgi:hypothetical protein
MAKTTRDTELARRPKIEKELLELYDNLDKAYLDAADRINDTLDYWDIYGCDTSDKQFYQGNQELFIPLVKDAIDARVTRFTNQVFPGTGRCVEVVTADGSIPHELIALMDHYVEATHLRDLVVPPLFRNGDVEGQWNLYVSWIKRKRKVTQRVKTGPMIDGLEHEELGTFPDVKTEDIEDSRPHVEVIPDTDVVILPASADSIDDALAEGGSVCILRRWTKAKIRQMIDDEEFIEDRAEELITNMSNQGSTERKDAKKTHVDSAGIKSSGKYVLGYEVWTRIKVDGERQLVRAYFGGPDMLLGAKLNPYWCDLCPLISAPVDKVSGSSKGVSKVKAVAELQYAANDWLNQGADSATFALQPIIMTDPISNPRVGSMVLSPGAVWEVDPNKTHFAEFPQLWKDALELVGTAKAQIFQTLGVNPSMIPGQTGGKQKRNQAEVANEQQVDLLTTADVVTACEASVLTPLVQRYAWYDMQFRDEAISVKAYGRAGQQAFMEQVEPLQMNTNYWFKWLGVEQARSAQQIQQQIAAVNVLNGLPPDKMNGKKLDLGPFAERLAENAFGPRLAPLILIDITKQQSMDPLEENGMLEHGFDLPVMPGDDDAQHIQIHMQAMQQGDPHGTIRAHLVRHTMQMAMKQQAMAQQQGGEPGRPGGAGPGVAGTPKPGGQPAQPKMRGPAGAVHPDRMPLSMPRKM